MFVKSPEQVKSVEMDMPGVKGVTMQLMIGREDGAPNFAMRLFTVEANGHTPLHSHNYEHEVMVVSGEGQVTGGVDGGTIRPIKGGDVIFMPANETHQFRNTGSGELKFMCLVPVSFDCGKGECAVTPGS
ncbi:L-ectoine synthase [Poriferisphaera corsica]|uniref:L-ectoine synthase n=1 Tax=Poriferisphaera corsica TaxID=2528020 RepID=A0A517YVF1_9BACT|nr:cupin domain-containing protein [Poriferisphaera corsica]QDU34209.1 L-ectoine synthase [Poriferisphaera corsica]